MTEEGYLSRKHKYEFPIFDSIEATHKAYNSLIPILLNQAGENDKVIEIYELDNYC